MFVARSQRKCAVCTLIALVFSCCLLFGGSLSTLRLDPRPCAPVTRGHPFGATYHCQTNEHTAVTVIGTIQRDSVGRLSTAWHFSSGMHCRLIEDWSSVDTSAHIEDGWATAPGFFLDLTGKAVTKLEGVSKWLQGWGYLNAGRVIDTGDKKTIHGVACRRIQFRNSETAADEGDAWLSDDLGILMSDNEIKGHWQKHWEITEITLGEPPPNAFLIPAGFHSVDAEGSH